MAHSGDNAVYGAGFDRDGAQGDTRYGDEASSSVAGMHLEDYPAEYYGNRAVSYGGYATDQSTSNSNYGIVPNGGVPMTWFNTEYLMQGYQPREFVPGQTFVLPDPPFTADSQNYRDGNIGWRQNQGGPSESYGSNSNRGHNNGGNSAGRYRGQEWEEFGSTGSDSGRRGGHRSGRYNWGAGSRRNAQSNTSIANAGVSGRISDGSGKNTSGSSRNYDPGRSDRNSDGSGKYAGGSNRNFDGPGRSGDGSGRNADDTNRNSDGSSRFASGSNRNFEGPGRSADGSRRNTDEPNRNSDGPGRSSDGFNRRGNRSNGRSSDGSSHPPGLRGSYNPRNNSAAYYSGSQYGPSRGSRWSDEGASDRSRSDRYNDDKSSDRAKMLDQVATLLNNQASQRKREVKSANTTAQRHGESGSTDGGRGWSATPNSQHGESGSADGGRGWEATPSSQQSSTKTKSKKGGSKSKKQSKWQSYAGSSSLLLTPMKKEAENQRDRLTEQLVSGRLECLVCCDRLGFYQSVWSCQNCFHILHLKCVSKWALASTSKTEAVTTRQDTSWRCPACQFTYTSVPDNYTCFCTKYNSPQYIKGETPHSCGEVCGRAKKGCPHSCTLLCHPGPCPPCLAMVRSECGCGRTTQEVVCSWKCDLECDVEKCDKLLSCGLHRCIDKCHRPPCQPCHQKQTVVCHCGKESREVECGAGVEFSCGKTCGRQLECGNHDCGRECHSDTCGPCPYDPDKVTTCHCGAKQMKRSSCAEAVESCGELCTRTRPDCLHPCTLTCHPGPCPPCQVELKVSCRCGHNPNAVTPCHPYSVLGQKPVCLKKCTKKKNCRKHKCNQTCCVDSDHRCLQPCNKSLLCKQHRCELLCHLGNCPPCTRLSFYEMRCNCGSTVVYPPIECGARMPECPRPCNRQHDCEHAPTHTCHSMPECPPCTTLVSRTCYGGHETRKAVACYIAEYSCGLPCNKPLACDHRCIERCHGGPCPAECKQRCSVPRDMCGHPCSLPCHSGTPCTGQNPCSSAVEITCPCLRRTQSTTCWEFRRTWARHQMTVMAASASSKDPNSQVDPNKLNYKVLECDEECKVAERNRRLAIGLQIANPDLSMKLKPQYNDMMRQWLKREPVFCDMVHRRLTDLVQLAKQSKQKSRSYSFEVMPAAKRAFVHEYCKHFGCESMAYDAEPKRNIVATAYRDRCWLPSYSLMEVIQRENGQRKVPLPTMSSASSVRKPVPRPALRPISLSAWDKFGGNTDRDSGSGGSREAVVLPLSRGIVPATPAAPQGRLRPSVPSTSASSSGTPQIDYFDFTPTT